MPASTNLPKAQEWIAKTTAGDGNRMILARGCDAPLASYERVLAIDYPRIEEIFVRLLDKVQKGQEKSRDQPYLQAQFKALHYNLLKEIKEISKGKVQARNPNSGRGAISLGWQREQVGLAGQYALEGMDPQHRFGNFWEKVIHASQITALPTNQQEFQWLDAWVGQNESAIWQMVPESIRNSYVEYLDPQGRWKYRLKAHNKWVQQMNDSGKYINFDTSQCSVHDPRTGGRGRAIWVMGKNKGEWYAGSHVTGKFHHSSFLSGELIVCGGEIVCKDGYVLYISNKTGHYQAGARNLYNALRRLDRKVDFRGTQISVNVGNQREVWTTYEEFMGVEGMVERLGQPVISMDDPVRTGRHRAIYDELMRDNTSIARNSSLRGAAEPAAAPSGKNGDDPVYVPATDIFYTAATCPGMNETDPVTITQVIQPAADPDYQ